MSIIVRSARLASAERIPALRRIAGGLGGTYRDGLIMKMSQAQLAEGNRRLAGFAPNSVEGVPMPDPLYVKEIKLAGLAVAPLRRFAIINGKTLAAGESAMVRIAARNLLVQCVSIGDRSAVVAIGGIEGTRELVMR